MQQRSERKQPKAEARWVEYRIGFLGELSAALSRTLIPLLVGIGATFALVLAIGLVGEEGALPSYALTKALDMFARYSMLPICGFALLAWLMATGVQLIKETSTARALARAARAGAPKNEVPHPQQLEILTQEPGSRYLMFFFSHAAVLGLFLVIALFVLLFNPFDGGWLILAVPGAWLGVLALGWWLLITVVRPTHRRRADEVLQHWDIGQQAAARRRASGAAKGSSAVGKTAMKAANWLLNGAAALGVASIFLMQGLLFITHPNAQRWPGGQAGDRATLDEPVEALVDQGTVLFAVLVVLTIGLGVAGVLVQAVAQQRQRRALEDALADPDAARPPAELLREHSSRPTPKLAQLLAGIAGVTLCLGTTGWMLGTLDVASFADIYADANEVYGPLTGSFVLLLQITAGLLVLAISLNMGSVSLGRQLRNRLQARWPTDPEKPRPKAASA